jgi:pantoate--beta-alanine ligase
MRIVRSIKQVRSAVDQARGRGLKIALVPTMGYLHEGHLSLVRIARRRADFAAVSIFVNPAQFGPREDLARYPRNLRRDRDLLIRAGCDLLFYPSVRAIYPEGYRTYVEVEELGKVLCGRSRPGHFRGVATVVLKLLNIVKPDLAVFGRKDFQQAVVIRRMVRDLNVDVRIFTGPTVREKSGLAMSSRNKYLTPVERRNAAVIYRALRRVRTGFRKGESRDPKTLTRTIRDMVAEKGGRIDYVAITDPERLTPVKKAKRGDLVALAAFFGKTRLIDNIIL